MTRIKIAVTAYEPALYADMFPSLEECPALIIIDEYDRIQKYVPEITPRNAIKSKVDWIIGRGAKVVITGAMSDENYRKLRKAKIAIDWVAFGNVKDLVEIARERANNLLFQLDRPVYRMRYEKRIRPRIENGLIIYPCINENPKYIDELEKKAERQRKKNLLKSKKEKDNE